MTRTLGRRWPAAVALLLLTTSAVTAQEREPLRGPLQATSLLGEELYALVHEPGTDIADPRSNPAQIVADKLALAPDSVELRIELGLALSRSWRYREAIRFYDEALELDPSNWYAYRLRGHRYVSLREFDQAEEDLEKAAVLRPGDFDVWYHLGLARYLQGDFAGAAEAYRRCLETVEDDDESVAVRHWLYMSLRRAGEEKAAAEVLEPVTAAMEVEENVDYHRLLLMYKGELEPTDLVGENAEDLSMATGGYGVANWYLYNSQRERAVELFERIVAADYWPAFGFIAAEADLARLREE